MLKSNEEVFMMGLFDFFKMFEPSKIESKYNELMEKAYNSLIQDDDISQLSDEEKVFYVVYYFNAEWQNGGLCQFFVNSSRVYAPIIGEYLGIIGALEHKQMYEEFIKNNNIDVNDLSFFENRTISYQEKVNSYPFDKFDDEFYELPELDEYLEKYLEEYL